jgi:hypothetical protein
MRHSTPMILLALLTAVVPGCNCLNDLDRYSFEGDDDMGPTDQGPDTGEDDAWATDGERTHSRSARASMPPLTTRSRPSTSPHQRCARRPLRSATTWTEPGRRAASPTTSATWTTRSSSLAEALPALNPAPAHAPSSRHRHRADVLSGQHLPVLQGTALDRAGGGAGPTAPRSPSSTADGCLAGRALRRERGRLGNVRGEFDTAGFRDLITRSGGRY